MNLNLEYIAKAEGGQRGTTVNVPVQRKDLIIAQATHSIGNVTVELAGVSARLLSTWAGGRNNRLRHSVWEALASGTATLTIGPVGGNPNMDLVACVVRPIHSIRGEITIRGQFDDVTPYSVETPVQAGTVLFITQTGGGGVGQSATTTGITFDEWYNVLPEGAIDQTNGRMIARKATSSGIAVTSGGSAWILVTWIEQVGGHLRTGFVMV